MYCVNCGNQIDDNSKFCSICGNPCYNSNYYSQISQNNKKNKNKIILISSLLIATIVVSIVILIVALNSSQKGSSIVGQWYSSDDYILDFRESGYLVYRDDKLDSYQTNYSIQDDFILYIEKSENLYGGIYTYSEYAKKLDGDYWYIENDTLYLGTRTYFKK